MQKQYIKILSLFFIFLSACDTSSNSSSNLDYIITYQAIDGCTSGSKVFRGLEAKDTEIRFCQSLADNSANQYCAQFYRQELYKRFNCGIKTAKAWPYQEIQRNNQYFTFYFYEKENCDTGEHVFIGATERSVKRAYCKALKDEVFNRSCANADRQWQFHKENCSRYIR